MSAAKTVNAVTLKVYTFSQTDLLNLHRIHYNICSGTWQLSRDVIKKDTFFFNTGNCIKYLGFFYLKVFFLNP